MLVLMFRCGITIKGDNSFISAFGIYCWNFHWTYFYQFMFLFTFPKTPCWNKIKLTVNLINHISTVWSVSLIMNEIKCFFLEDWRSWPTVLWTSRISLCMCHCILVCACLYVCVCLYVWVRGYVSPYHFAVFLPDLYISGYGSFDLCKHILAD